MDAEDVDFSDFIASSIHDIKNSLNVQLGSLEMLADRCRQSGDTAIVEQLAPMIYEANRMNGNLIQILSLYKLGKSIYPIDFSDQTVREVIEEVLLQSQSIMDAKGIGLSLDCADDCHWYFDRDLVAGVLINALNNAYHYTDDKIRVVAAIVDGFLEIRVEDNGAGYPESFLQANVSAAKGISFISGSTGLGFYFSSRVAGLHKNGDRRGSVHIENGGAYGGGCFVLRLP